VVLLYHAIIQAINAPLPGHLFAARAIVAGCSVRRIRTLRHGKLLAATVGGGC